MKKIALSQAMEAFQEEADVAIEKMYKGEDMTEVSPVVIKPFYDTEAIMLSVEDDTGYDDSGHTETTRTVHIDVTGSLIMLKKCDASLDIFEYGEESSKKIDNPKVITYSDEDKEYLKKLNKVIKETQEGIVEERTSKFHDFMDMSDSLAGYLHGITDAIKLFEEVKGIKN